ncbi:MAG: hypothetical protein ACO1TE_24280 [Prosthecobacter sp.]
MSSLFWRRCLWVQIRAFIGPYEATDPQRLAEVYKVEFGTPLSEDVQELRTREVVVGDWAGTWVSFRASPATVEGLLRRHLQPSDRTAFDDLSGGANAPDWWQPDQDSITIFYQATPWRANTGTPSEGVLGHNAEKTRVYFMHSF